MGLFKMISEVMTALENPPAQGPSRRTQPAIPIQQVKTMVAQGKQQEAVRTLSATMNWSIARSEYFINDLVRSTPPAIKTQRIGRNDTSTKIDRIIREQRAAEAMAGGSIFDYIRTRWLRF